jgi:DNA modification methylase
VLPQSIPDSSIDLIYIDPPFFSNQDYEVIWGDGYEMRAFEDRWKGGIENYIAWMEPKLRECYRALKPTGTFYLHCDWHANYRLRMILDSIFGEDKFQNEIVWKRTTAHVDTRGFGHVHDTIFRYTKSNKFAWNPEYRPYSKEYMERYFKFTDDYSVQRGQFWTGDITGAGLRNGETGKPWHGFDPGKIGKGRHWIRTPKELDEMDADGRIYWPPKGGIPKLKRYLRELPGLPIDSVWDDIPSLGGLQGDAKERLGYPTQKPEALMERIIKTSSNPKDLVLDPMCGCGTTIVVAQKLGRKWIGIDVSPTACKLMANRMRKIGAQDIKLEGLPKSEDEVRGLQPFEFQNWVCQKIFARPSERKVGDMGIDGWTMDGRPLQIKQSEHIGRNVIDNFETAIKRVKKDRGVIVALSFGKGAYEEVARVKNVEGVEIELKTVEDIMREI